MFEEFRFRYKNLNTFLPLFINHNDILAMRKLLAFLSYFYKVYVGLCFIVTLIFFYPFIYITLSRVSWRRFSFPINVCWSWAMRILSFVHIYKLDRNKIPQGPYLIVANHTSFFDIFLMYSMMSKHRFLFLGKSEILSYPLVKTFFKRLNIPVFRNDRVKAAKSFIQAKNAVSNGWSIMLFPEGGIPDDHLPNMIPFKDGAFKLAKLTNLPIIPITFLDNYHIFSEPTKLGFAHPGISRVRIHEAILPDEIQLLNEKELSDKVWKTISQGLNPKNK